MRHPFIFISLLVFLPSQLSADFGLNIGGVYGGTKAPNVLEDVKGIEKAFLPSVVLLRLRGAFQCSGVLLRSPESTLPEGHSDLVLTASHCINLELLSSLDVRSSAVYTAATGIETLQSGVAEAWTHLPTSRRVKAAVSGQNTQLIVPYDLALLRLWRPIKGKGLELKKLWPKQLLDRKRRLFVAGYGAVPNEASRNSNNDLYWAELDASYRITEKRNPKRDTYISILGKKRDGEPLPKTCRGDSGGPLVVVENNKAYVVGALSTISGISDTYPCGNISNYTYVKESTQKIMEGADMRFTNQQNVQEIDWTLPPQ